jgi:hypothetical protein
MARVRELEEMLAAPSEISAEEMEAHLALVGKEAAFVECLAGELQAGHLRPAELPALLENLAARLARLANPAAHGSRRPSVETRAILAAEEAEPAM